MQVFEETGLDIAGRFDDSDCVEIWVKSGVSQKRTKLFFVPGIDTSTEFAPQARKVDDWPVIPARVCPDCESTYPGNFPVD